MFAWYTIAMLPTSMAPNVVITAENHGERPVQIATAGLESQDGSGRRFVIARMGPLDRIPGTVARAEYAAVYFDALPEHPNHPEVIASTRGLLREHGHEGALPAVMNAPPACRPSRARWRWRRLARVEEQGS